ncbi:similar to Saccharomyces cerevisiae YLR050C Putative protein of unknown function [Maudiozyma saulgeensis]|uniref:Efficient mitochondria targeting-associated protein 19 n=1 Tax=Maudiozyma saulgeensis TaxID=1789683 RepID=A0A1X7R333_9SACH|nr:similar to Saccharomyces cerevisiae YLR050C Putative protein of unknown function [Kazachstania saulgeensis]
MGCTVLSSPGEQLFYTLYFIIHIPLTIFIDSTICFSPMTETLNRMIEWHISENNDFLLLEKPSWFFWMVVVELIFQLPAFFYFIKNMNVFSNGNDDSNKKIKADKLNKRKIVAKLLKLYGLNASLTSLFCIWVIYQRGYYPGNGLPLNSMDKFKLIAYYTPTFLIPLRLCML